MEMGDESPEREMKIGDMMMRSKSLRKMNDSSPSLKIKLLNSQLGESYLADIEEQKDSECSQMSSSQKSKRI